MTLPNHIAGGIVFTGVFAGIAGVNILESPGLIVMTLVASTIADIDVPSSLWGRLLKPLSKRINRRFGHRTFTHSLLFMGLLWSVTWIVCSSFAIEAPYPTVFLLAFGSHLIFDMMTVQGVLLFYPYKKQPCVIPADPNLRLKTNNPGSELAVFGFFVMSGLFMQPLMADGFWTSYNRMFGTLAHLQSEFEKSEDLLQVNYRYREASQEFSGIGYAIEATGSSTTLWSEQRGWEFLDGSPSSSRTVLEVIPTHTDQQYSLVRQSFVSISPDSLHRLLGNEVIYHLELAGNEQFEANYEAKDGRQQLRQSKFYLSLVESIGLREVVVSSKQREIVYRTNPRIATLATRAAKLRRAQNQLASDRSEYRQRLTDLETKLASTKDIYRRTQLLDQLQELRKQKEKPDTYGEQLRELEVQMRELRAQDQLDHEERLAAAAEKDAAKNVALRVSGVATLVRFSGSDS